MSFLFSFVAFFVVFGDILGFSLLAFENKGDAVLMQTGVRCFICFFDCSRSLARSLVPSSFESGPCVASPGDVLLLHNWGNNYLFWSRTALALGC